MYIMTTTPDGATPQVDPLIQFIANLTAPIIARETTTAEGVLVDKDGRRYLVTVDEIVPNEPTIPLAEVMAQYADDMAECPECTCDQHGGQVGGL